jgi:hypothetical protein
MTSTCETHPGLVISLLETSQREHKGPKRQDSPKTWGGGDGGADHARCDKGLRVEGHGVQSSNMWTCGISVSRSSGDNVVDGRYKVLGARRKRILTTCSPLAGNNQASHTTYMVGGRIIILARRCTRALWLGLASTILI